MIDQIKTAALQPLEIPAEINSRWNQVAKNGPKGEEAIDFLGDDWDTLIILDACRADVFSEYNTLPGETSSAISNAGSTVEWLRKNLANATYLDVVYTTANPQYYKYQDELNTDFCHVEHVWQTHWDEELSTVPPTAVVSKAKDMMERYPNKRHIIHFNQPHGPYIGDFGRNTVAGSETPRFSERSLIEHIRVGFRWLSFSPEDHRRAYIENFNIVNDVLEDWLPEIEGRTLITADHGELFFERIGPVPTLYRGHRKGIYHPNLVTVPYHIYTNGERREIIRAAENSEVEYLESSLKERLEDLGYH